MKNNKDLQTETVTQIGSEIIASLVLNGDISKLNNDQKLKYYSGLCQNLGLNPLTQPFQILKLQGKETLYASKNASEQLRKVHNISLISLDGKQLNDLYIVTVVMQDQTGRKDISTAAVNISGLKGDSLANAIMKAETKAKRRGTLSICGLGMLDETEVETIPGAIKSKFPVSNTVSGIELTQGNKDRDYTLEADNCNTLEELQNWYKSLTKAEQSGPAKGVTKQRKEYLLKVKEMEKELSNNETEEAEEITDNHNYQNKEVAALFAPPSAE